VLMTRKDMVCETLVCPPFNHMTQVPTWEYFIEFQRTGNLKFQKSHSIVTRYVTSDISCNIDR
jgi:hypothetical protein